MSNVHRTNASINSCSWLLEREGDIAIGIALNIGMNFCRRAHDGSKFHGVEILRMRTFDVDYVTQNNSYVQLLASLCVVLPLLRELRQTSTERPVKPAVVRDFCGAKISLHLAMQ